MFARREYAFVGLLFAVLSLVHGEIVQWKSCPTPDPNAPSTCTIHEVRIDPCPEAAERKPCRVKKGSHTNITFEYTPNFEATTLETKAYWPTQLADLPLMGMETDGCSFTPCPVQEGQRQTYSMQLPISKKFPSRSFDVKWKIWNEQLQECCFVFQIKLHK